MNLHPLVEQYITYRQALGEGFRTNATLLRQFYRAVGAEAAITAVTPERVAAFLAGTGPITSAWHGRYHTLRGFYGYALSRGYVTTTPLPAVVPKRPPRFVPHIYSPAELGRLRQALADDAYRRPPRLAPDTVHAVLAVLYGAGLRVSEALALNVADVDLGSAVATVRRTKFYKTRLVPLGPQLGQILTTYAAGRRGVGPPPAPDVPFFTGRNGTRVHRSSLAEGFRRLCAAAGIHRPKEARYQPRLHDLRHTFAVHRLTAWYRQGADVQRLLPHLAVYLGHVNLASTQVYLTMTPELLQQAGARFEQYAGKEARHA